jgi:hypothetical protein
MAWQAQQGIALNFLHPVRDALGNYVAGQAANVTKSLIGPDRLPSGETVTLSDFVTGWVQVNVTLTNALGMYTLSLTNPNPPTADGRITDYDILVTPGMVAQALLTSLDRVRTRLQLTKVGVSPPTPIQPGDAHPFDSLINLLISEISDDYQGRLGRTFAETAYVEYRDGTGRPSLVLGSGPLVSLSLLESVEYTDDGAGGVTEVRTTVPRHTYVLSGLRTQSRFTGRGRVDLLGGAVFTTGPKKYRATYVAGFASTPESVVGLATEKAVFLLMTRETGHLLSQALGDGSTSFLRPQQMLEMENDRLLPYLLEAA